MTEKKTKPEYQITWPEGAELKMDPKHLMEIRNSLETQFKLMIYKQPGFKFFPSLGNTNFFQHFRTNDGIDFGVCHLYWDKNADDGIDYVDEDGNLMDKKGGWKVRWLPAGCYDVIGEPSPISKEGWKKIAQAYVDKSLPGTIPDEKKIKQFEKESEEEVPKYLN